MFQPEEKIETVLKLFSNLLSEQHKAATTIQLTGMSAAMYVL